MNKLYILDDDELDILNQIENGELTEDLSEFENLKLAAENSKGFFVTNKHQ